MGSQEFEALFMISVLFLAIGIIFAIVPIIMIMARKKRAQKCDKFTIFYNNENPKMIYVEEEQFIIKFITTIFFIISIAMLFVGIIVGAQLF